MKMRSRMMKQIKKGDNRSFKKFVQHYHQSVYNVCYFILGDCNEAENLSKAIFLDVYNHLEEDCKVSDKTISLLLFRKTVNLARTRISERKHSERGEKGPILNAKNKNDIRLLLMHLSFKERIVLILNASNHLSVQEISEILEITHSDTTYFIWHGRERIREMISQ